MANHNPVDPITARMAKVERRRNALAEMANRLTRAADIAEQLLEHESPELRLKAIHALNQCTNTAVKLYEVGELEYRLEQIIETYGLHTPPTTPTYRGSN